MSLWLGLAPATAQAFGPAGADPSRAARPALLLPVQGLLDTLRQNQPRRVRRQIIPPEASAVGTGNVNRVVTRRSTRTVQPQAIDPASQFQPGSGRRQPARYSGYDNGYGLVGSDRVRDRSAEDGRIRAALLLPLSGEHAALGNTLLQAAEMALFQAGGESFDLMPRDTRGSPIGARQAAVTAVRDGADIILGPLFAEEALEAHRVARQARLPLLSFSNNWTLTEAGIIVLGFQPQNQIERIVSYAVAQGSRRIAVLAPGNAYGEAVVAAATATAATAGGAVVLVERYDVRRPDLQRPLQALASTPFDALLIGDGGDRLTVVAEALTAAGFASRGVRILGPGLWDGLDSRTLPLLEGALYAAPDPRYWQSFQNSFERAFGTRPQRVATLSYDATALAAVLARRHNAYDRESPFQEPVLKRDSGFQGTDGLFRILPNGLVERSLAILQIGQSGARIVDPAPNQFRPRLSDPGGGYTAAGLE